MNKIEEKILKEALSSAIGVVSAENVWSIDDDYGLAAVHKCIERLDQRGLIRFKHIATFSGNECYELTDEGFDLALTL